MLSSALDNMLCGRSVRNGLRAEGAPPIMPHDAIAALTAVGERFRAFATLQEHARAVSSLFDRTLADFLREHRSKCQNKGEFHKCAA